MILKSKKIYYPLAFVLILAVSSFTFFPSFSLALFGDDWLAFVRYLYHLGPNPESPGRWNHLNYFLTPYGSQDILMGLLQNIYGYKSSLYYLTSYILRLIAAFSFYPLINYLTKSHLAAFFAILFFSIATTGLDATNWVFNMPSYISITFFNLFLYFYIRVKGDKKKKLLIPAMLLFYLAYIWAPIRMHGVLPFIFLLELFWFIRERNIPTLRFSLVRLTSIIAVFLFINFTGQSSGTGNIWSDRFNEGLTAMVSMLGQGRVDFFLYPITIFGATIFPRLFSDINLVPVNKESMITSSVIIFITFSFIVYVFSQTIEGFKKYTLKLIIPLFVVWTAILFVVLYKNERLFYNFSDFFLQTLIGGFVAVLAFFLLILRFKNFHFSTAIFSAIIWTLMSYFAAWWQTPYIIFPTTYRYLIPSVVGITVLFAIIISLGKNRAAKLSLFPLFSMILIIHLLSTRAYLSVLNEYHSQRISDKIWAAIPYYPEIGTDSKFRYFYFEGESQSQGIIHNVITFGFPTHLGLIYKYYIHHGSGNNIATNRADEVISAVTDGQSLKAHGYNKGPIDVNQIYAFRLIGKDNLINITTEARQKLIRIVQDYN